MKRTGLTAARFEAARRVIRAHYGITRPVTDSEVESEIASLKRKGPANWDDVHDYPLASRLQGLGFVLDDSQIIRGA